MTEVEKKEVAPEQPKVEDKETIAIDIDGVSIPNVPIALAKQIIEKRQATKKELGNLKEQVAKAEAESKSAHQKALLLEAMKSQDIDSVKSQVAQEYLDKISKYENKIFKGELKSIMASQGVLPSALDDAVNLALQGTKVSLEGEEIKLGDKSAKEAIEEFLKARPHLIAVKSPQVKEGTKVTQPKVTSNGEFQKFAQGLFKK
jgi:hypothetical protein